MSPDRSDAKAFSLDSKSNLVGAISFSYLSVIGITDGSSPWVKIPLGNADYYVVANSQAVNNGLTLRRAQISAQAYSDGTISIKAFFDGDGFEYICRESAETGLDTLYLSKTNDCPNPLTLFWETDPASGVPDNPVPTSTPTSLAMSFVVHAVFPTLAASARTTNQHLFSDASFGLSYLGSVAADYLSVNALGQLIGGSSGSTYKLTLQPRSLSDLIAPIVFAPDDGVLTDLDVQTTFYEDGKMEMLAIGPGGRIFGLGTALPRIYFQGSGPASADWIPYLATQAYQGNTFYSAFEARWSN